MAGAVRLSLARRLLRAHAFPLRYILKNQKFYTYPEIPTSRHLPCFLLAVKHHVLERRLLSLLIPFPLCFFDSLLVSLGFVLEGGIFDTLIHIS